MKYANSTKSQMKNSNLYKKSTNKGETEPLTIVYRLSSKENNSKRPKWYSKELCFLSFLKALENSRISNIRSILFVDKNSTNYPLLNPIIKMAKQANFTIKTVKISGNCNSYLEAVKLSLVFSKGIGLILLAEDDYLWLPESLAEMSTAFEEIIEAHYITPYDHPVRYDTSFSGGPDLNHWCHRIYCIASRHFRAQESTCMTFMVRAKVLKEDASVHRSYAEVTKNCPNDRALFRALQHLGNCGIKPKKKRLLLGPMPSLATHAYLPYLSPVVKWEHYALKLKKIITFKHK
jgi:hypothetical protein